MTQDPPQIIEPGKMIGVLGGGQLGAMFTASARRLGYRVAVWDPDPDAPALRLADHPVNAPFTSDEGESGFARAVVAATYEWENVPSPLVARLAEQIPIRPAPQVLQTLQNRAAQKTFLAHHGIPVAPFRAYTSVEELAVPVEIGFPAICKTATAGYDGKGQWRLGNHDDVPHLKAELLRRRTAPPAPDTADSWIVEKHLSFAKELSVLVVRGSDGASRTYPVVENVHQAGILRSSRVPASVPNKVIEQAQTLGRNVVDALNGIGVFCIEMFLMPNEELLVNEVAPRPHNSGHYTLDCCTVSQFEQQVRALCGLPLGEIRLLSPAIMVNLLGEDLTQISHGGELRRLMQIPGAKLRVYGKRTVRPGRKMGHVTFVAEKAEQAVEYAEAFLLMLRKRSPGGPT